MSIIAAFRDDETVTIAVDTATFAPDGSPASISKMVPLVHMPAVLAYRGCALYLEMLFASCHSKGGTFDKLLDAMPSIISEAMPQFHNFAGQLGLTDPQMLEKHDIVLAGWSEREGRMVCRSYLQERAADGFNIEDVRRMFGAPWDPSLISLAPDVKRFADAQVRKMHREAPHAAAGGRLMVARLSREGMTIRCAGDLPGRPMKRSALLTG